MSPYININGKLLPAADGGIRVDNRAFRYGYGLFETMLVKENVVRLEGLHWERLFKGIAQLQLSTPRYFERELKQALYRTVEKNGLETLCRVRLQVYGGEGGLYDGDGFKAGYAIEVFPVEAHVSALNEIGLCVGVSNYIKHADALSALKTGNLAYTLAARQAKMAMWNDALITNDNGHIVESTIANIFWTRGKKVFTPPLTEGCIAGVMRAHLLEKLPGHQYEVIELPLSMVELKSAQGVFMSNAVRGIKWVKSVGDWEFEISLAKDIHTKVIGSL